MSSEEYRKRADDCDRLAAAATNDEVRKTLLCLGNRWRKFERQAELARLGQALDHSSTSPQDREVANDIGGRVTRWSAPALLCYARCA